MPTRNGGHFHFQEAELAIVRRSGSRLGPLDSPGDWLQPTCFQEGFGPESSAATLPEKA